MDTGGGVYGGKVLKQVIDCGGRISARGSLRGLFGPWNVTGGCNVGAGVETVGWEACLECEHCLGMWDGSDLSLWGCG